MPRPHHHLLDLDVVTDRDVLIRVHQNRGVASPASLTDRKPHANVRRRVIVYPEEGRVREVSSFLFYIWHFRVRVLQPISRARDYAISPIAQSVLALAGHAPLVLLLQPVAEDADDAVRGSDGRVDESGFRAGSDKGGGGLKLREDLVTVEVDSLFGWEKDFVFGVAFGGVWGARRGCSVA